MTANQIAAEANAIRRQELEETKRHNVESEFLSRDKNQIEAAYNALTVDLKQQELSLKEKLETLSLQITRSQGDEKNRIQSEYNDIQRQLAGIQQQIADTEASYKTSMAANAAMVTGETRRTNVANEEIRRKANIIKEHEVDITERVQKGETAYARAQIVNLSTGGAKSPFGLATGFLYRTEEAARDLDLSAPSRAKITSSSKLDSDKGTKTKPRFEDRYKGVKPKSTGSKITSK